MTKPLTPAQRACLNTVAALLAEGGIPPSFQEIGARLGGRTTKAVSEMLVRLERDGYLTREAGLKRALALTPAGWLAAGYITPIPLLEFPGGIPEVWL